MKKVLIHCIINCYFGNMDKYDKKTLRDILRKLTINDIENLDLFLNKYKEIKIK